MSEILNSCTENSVIDSSNDVYSQEISIKPKFYNDGFWKPITNVLSSTGDPDFSVGVNELVDFKINPELGNGKPAVRIGAGNSYVTYTPVDTNISYGVVENNSVFYPEAWNNADLIITVANHKVEKDIYLKLGHPHIFSFRIDDKRGLNDDLQGSDFYLKKPFLHKELFPSISLNWNKSIVDGKLIYTVEIPEGDWSTWSLDPTFSVQPDSSTGQDTYIKTNTTGYGNEIFLSAGHDAGITSWSAPYSFENRTLINFNISSIPSGSTISSGNIIFKATFNNNGQNFLWDMKRVRRAWNESATWVNSGVTAWGTAGAYNTTSDIDSVTIASQTIGTINALSPLQINLNTTLLQQMITGGSWTNNGFIFFINNPTLLGFIDCSSSENTNSATRPSMTVVYTAGSSFTAKSRRLFAMPINKIGTRQVR